VTDPKTTPDPLAFLAPNWPQAHVVDAHRRPWQQAPTVIPHVAKTVVVRQGAGELPAADADRRSPRA
jgi:hypothetical protein